jgi:hypothetical protein
MYSTTSINKYFTLDTSTKRVYCVDVHATISFWGCYHQILGFIWMHVKYLKGNNNKIEFGAHHCEASHYGMVL